MASKPLPELRRQAPGSWKASICKPLVPQTAETWLEFALVGKHCVDPCALSSVVRREYNLRPEALCHRLRLVWLHTGAYKGVMLSETQSSGGQPDMLPELHLRAQHHTAHPSQMGGSLFKRSNSG
ncbi:hypothetical protein CRV24_003197 [Beauveria bassiana]|nr:hypothetical protein CRV24_003197 [Beauveria bassiana]